MKVLEVNEIDKVSLLTVIAYLQSVGKTISSDKLFSLYLESLSNEKNNFKYENKIVIKDEVTSNIISEFYEQEKSQLVGVGLN